MILETELNNARVEYYSNTQMPLKEIILQEISQWQQSDDYKLMKEGEEYYKGDTAILERDRQVVGKDGRLQKAHNLANNKLVHNFVRKLVDQKVSYLFAYPFTIQTESDKYSSILEDYFNKGFMKLIKNIGTDAINNGIAWLQAYYEEGKLKFQRIPSREIIPLWKDAEHTKLDGIIRSYNVIIYEGTNQKTITKVEFWSNEGVRRYIMDNGTLIEDVEAGEFSNHFKAEYEDGREESFNWNRVPFIYFKYNDNEQPLVKFVKSLVDDYDKQRSDNSNNIEDLPNSIYVVRNYDNTDGGEFRKNLSTYRVAFVSDDGGIDTLKLDIDTEAYKNHIEQTRRDIYEFGRGVDTQTDKFGNSPSGISLKFLYSDLDLDCNTIETEFQASLEYLLWFIDMHLINTSAGDFREERVDFVFTRNTLINESDTIENCQKSIGVISDETIIANHPWSEGVEDELERLRAERNRDLNKYSGYEGLTGDTGVVNEE